MKKKQMMKINNKYNGNNNFSKRNTANFEQRDYADFDLTKIYANADALAFFRR